MCFITSLAKTFLANIEKAILPHSHSSPFLYAMLRYLAPQYLLLQKSYGSADLLETSSNK